jgi:molybdopterin molybdotransferase
VEIFFRQVAIRPGKPAVFGRKGGCLVFGLPGNPVSSLVVFQVLVAPALRKMQGTVSRLMEKADQADRKAAQKKRKAS